jgi:hypothetical protein
MPMHSAIRRQIVQRIARGLIFLATCASVAGQSGLNAEPSRRAARIVLDPATGERWLLMADPVHPGGPGLLVPDGTASAASANARSIAAPQSPVIRAGDRLLIEQSDAHFEATLEAIATEPASIGSIFTARLSAGNGRVCVIALGPGRAALAPVSILNGGPR